MRVILVGKGQMLSAMIEGCHNCGGVKILGVLRYENLLYNRFRLALHDFFNTSIENTLINKYKLKDLHFKSVNNEEFRKFLIKNNVDLLLVGTWKEKIEKETFDIPHLASVNIHPSLLPEYRGANPYFHAIKNREKYSGFTFHLIDKNFDTGAILYQQKVEIQPFYTSKELRNRITFEVQNILPIFLKQLDNGEITPVEQGKGSYCKNIEREDMMLDFNAETAEEISARIRALHPWLPAYVTIIDKFYIPNPYNLQIIDKKSEKMQLNSKKREIIAPYKGGKSLIMRDIKKYKN